AADARAIAVTGSAISATPLPVKLVLQHPKDHNVFEPALDCGSDTPQNALLPETEPLGEVHGVGVADPHVALDLRHSELGVSEVERFDEGRCPEPFRTLGCQDHADLRPNAVNV